MNKQIIAYFAGILDGEGSVNITYLKKRDEFRLRLQVVNTDKRLIDWLFANLGGHCYEPKRLNTRNPQWKKRYEWFLYTKKSLIPFLKSVLPYLVVKREQVEVAIKFIETTGTTGVRLSRDVYETRKECKEHLNFLNKRGPSEQRLSEKTP